MEIVFNSQTFSLQHYTKDADGLCTRLIKPKLMEGTVAAQDEFSRSKSTQSSLHSPTGTLAPIHTGTLCYACLLYATLTSQYQMHEHTHTHTVYREILRLLRALIALISRGWLIFVWLGTTAGLHRLSRSISSSVCLYLPSHTHLTRLILTLEKCKY